MNAIQTLEKQYRKPGLPQVQSGDTVRVHQLIREGNKTRTQIFEGVVIRVRRATALTADITVRRIASGIGVEKTYLLHSPNVVKVDILRRAKVRRNFLTYLRDRRGKSARLQEVTFDKSAANFVAEAEPEVVEEAAAENVTPEAVESDAELTEIDAAAEGDALNDAVSTEDIVREENKAAAAEGNDSPEVTGDNSQDDEEATKGDEANAGVAKADDEDTRAQKPVE